MFRRLVNADNLEENNNVDFDMKTEKIFSNDVSFDGDRPVFKSKTVDIIISFEPCIHLKHRDKTPNTFEEDFGEECDAVYAHAHFYG
jgi:hypothetical protein